MEFLLSNFIHQIEAIYPLDLAEEWDPVGLHFGNLNSTVSRIMTTLDVTESVVEEAISQNVDTIVAHHPLIFSSIKRLDDRQMNIELYRTLLSNRINVYAMHTNVDRQQNGMNDWLANRLGLINVRDLANQPLNTEMTPELGRVGDLPEALSHNELYQHILKQLGAPYLQVVNPSTDLYHRIAIVGGSAYESIEAAIKCGADAFITGDVTYHKVLEASTLPITTIDAGHFIEQCFIKEMAQILHHLVPEHVTIIESQTNRDPRQLIIRKDV